MIVFDRILNKEISIDQIEKSIALGRYIFKSDQTTLKLNEGKVKQQDFLAPCKSNEGFLSDKSEKIKLVFNENELLNETVSSLVKHTLLDISEELDIIDDLSDLKDINILLRNFDERLEISEFELFLQKKLFHLEEVCREPSYHLKREITKQNVARAKRIPVKAINYLAAHTEDWSRRRIRSVEPRKILSEIIDYDLEIYENQVASSFIDKLLVYFSHRMVNEIEVIDSFIQKIEHIIESRKRINTKDKLFWYKKLNRDYTKIGKAIDSIEQSRIKVEKIKEFISSLQMRLFALLKSDLYLSNSNHKSIISQKLKRTNLFDNHQHYRFVKILWDKFHKKETLSCQQKSEENQKVIKSYIDFSWILIFRSLFQMGFTETEKKNDHSFDLSNSNIPLIKVNVTKTSTEIINLTINNKKITFIPLPATKELSVQNLPGSAYLLTLFGADHSDHMVKISPSDINSEDRITAIIFKFVLELLAEDFLYQLNSQNISQFKILKDWLINKKTLILNKGKHGKIDFSLKRKLYNSEEKELEKTISKQKQYLSARTDIRSKELKKLEEVENELLVKGKAHFENYEVCIGCFIRKETNLKSGYRNGFKYSCSNKDCAVEYGFNIDDAGNKKIFYKVPDSDVILKNIKDKEGENKDLILNAFGYEYINL